MGWASRMKGNGRDGSAQSVGIDEPDTGLRMFAMSCGCGWTAAMPTMEASLGQLVKHAAEAHRIIARPALDDFSLGFAQNAAKRCLDRAAGLEKRLTASPIAGPDGRSQSAIDVPAEMVMFMREASMAMTAMLNLLLEARTGQACITRPPAASS